MTQAVHDAGGAILTATGITKSFGGVHALGGVDLTLRPQSVLAIAGENGAGKSTLIKTLTGVYQPDEGTIVIDGDAKRACLLPAAKLAGATVLTIEGVNRGAEIHPIQKALIEAGAVQCGYCIPGIVLELYALFTKNVNATDDEIKTALSRHFCRCTGYEAIWEGAKLAQKYMKG